MKRALDIVLTCFHCTVCGRVLALMALDSVRRPITLTCPDCATALRIGPPAVALPALVRYDERVEAVS